MRLVWLVIIGVISISFVLIYVQYTDLQYISQSNISQYAFYVQKVDFLENPKTFDNYEFLWGEFLISKFNSADLYQQTHDPSYDMGASSTLSYDDGKQLISTFDELLNHSETQSDYRKYDVIYDEKYFIITISNCGGPCPPYE